MELRRSQGDTWELAWRGPASSRAPVRFMAGFAEAADRGGRVVEPATPGVRLVILIEGTLRVGPREVRSFIAAPRVAPVAVGRPASYRGIEVGLSVASAAAFAGMPLGELGDAVRPLDEVLGNRADELHERLGRAKGWGDRFSVLDSCLRVPGSPPVDERMQWAWREIRRSGGQVRVGAIAEELGWSRRHFGSMFRQCFAVTPKAAARLVRFERAAGLLAAGTSPARVAAACGYFDQAHMHRDFALFGGRTPGPGRGCP